MALIPQNLKEQLEIIFLKQATQDGKYQIREAQRLSIEVLATELSTAIDAYIKTATVNPGIPVTTAGTAAAQSGATTGPGTLS